MEWLKLNLNRIESNLPVHQTEIVPVVKIEP